MFELKLNQSKTSVINQDDQGAIFLENNRSSKSRTKHIDVRHHFIREKVEEGRIMVKYCPTSEMVADILTKPLNKGPTENTGRTTWPQFLGQLVRPVFSVGPYNTRS
ncbi:hypothetical protein B5P42_31440, partial [Bacillus sp. SRB_331]